jgi:micrococcal nuclease
MGREFKRKCLKIFLLLAILTCLSADISFAESSKIIRTVAGTVTKVSDGDTIHVTTPNQTRLTVRPYGIDAPETPKINRHTGHVNKPGQPFGNEAWGALTAKILRKKVRVDIIDIDYYKRMVGIIWTDSRNINLEMIRAGYAEAFVEYLKDPYRARFIQAEKEARSMKRGIWSLSGYERPRHFRKRLHIGGGDG